MYSERFRKKAIELVETSGLSKKEIAQKLDISTSTLNRWIRLNRDAEPTNLAGNVSRDGAGSQSRTDEKAVETKDSGKGQKSGQLIRRSPAATPIKSHKKKAENTANIAGGYALRSDKLIIDKNATTKLTSQSQFWWQRMRYAVAIITLMIGFNVFLFWWPSSKSAWLWPQTSKLDLSQTLTNGQSNAQMGAAMKTLGTFARLAPLSPDPYEIKLTELGANTGDPDMVRLTAFSEAVLIRDKRKIAPRLVRLQNFVASRDWDLAVNELSSIYTLWPDGRERVIESFIGLMNQDAAANAIIIEQLKSKPRWGWRLVSQLPIDSLASADARAAIAKYPDQHSKYVQQIAQTQGYRSAYLAWLSLLETTDNRRVSFPIDANFDGSDAPKPFNWSFHQSNVELDGRGGLYVNYDGRRPTRFAWQIILLTAGDYVLRTDWDGAFKTRAGDLEWRISCQDSDVELVTLTLSQSLETPPQNEAAFTVPVGNCSFLTLGLYGVPGEYPDTIRMTIDYAQIITAGAENE